MSGMAEIYIDTVKLVARMLPERIEKMDRFIMTDLQSFTVEVHGLKSCLKNIGAENPGNNAALLEHAALESDIAYCNENFPAFRALLTELSDSLNEVLCAGTDGSKEKADKSSLVSIIPVVKNTTENYDSILASELLTPFADFSYDDETDELLERIILSLDASDYDGAIAGIEEMEEILNG